MWRICVSSVKIRLKFIKKFCKNRNSKKKMASLGLRKDENGDYKYIDPNDTTSEFVPVRNHGRKSSHN